MSPPPDPAQPQPFRTEVRVAWSDVDLAGVCYFGHFFRYFEYAEADLFRATGRSLVEFIESQEIWLMRVEAHCRYRRPARYNDLLQLDVTIQELQSKTYVYHFDVRREGDEEIAAEGDIKIISVSRADRRPVALPAALVELLRPYCG